jgi:hypothetical protein
MMALNMSASLNLFSDIIHSLALIYRSGMFISLLLTRLAFRFFSAKKNKNAAKQQYKDILNKHLKYMFGGQ